MMALPLMVVIATRPAVRHAEMLLIGGALPLVVVYSCDTDC